ncbi:hypothetical protein L596_025780 [Steinernema carpocapsae]|uniref:Uncharacterized protein n=1 Tax=Steinernema carpocapsae TaxID=34508 RepID=A0A4U5M8U0_STECR|nr:hypothetical protein L596_025780 [Steinernema carpocapsae]
MWKSVVLVLCVSLVQAAKESKEPSMNDTLLEKKTSFNLPNSNFKFLEVKFYNPCNLAQPLCLCYNSTNAKFTPQMIHPRICGGRHGYLCTAVFDTKPMVLADYMGTMNWNNKEDKEVVVPLEGGLTSILNVPFYVPRFAFDSKKQLWNFDIWKGEGCEKGSIKYRFVKTRMLRRD